MPTASVPWPQRFAGIAILLMAAMPAGCGSGQALHRQADATYLRLASAEPAAVSGPAAPPVEASAAKPTLYFAPSQSADFDAAPANPPAVAEAPAPGLFLAAAPVETKSAEPAKSSETVPAEKPIAPFADIRGESFGHILKDDARAFPGHLWKGTKESFANPTNLVILTLALGADRWVRASLDHDVRDYFREHRHGSLSETGEFGDIAGHPGTHFAIAGAWYIVSVAKGDSKNHAFSYTMLEALTINGLSTELLKVSMNDRDPKGDRYGWPSGHMSSAMCFASVMHEYYGWEAGVPLYLLAGYVGASRLQDREHDLSDLVFGAALGFCIGHSVVKGELPQVAGFTVLPYGGSGVGGLMLMKQW